MMAAAPPTASDPIGPTKPQAGVIATSPATAPEAPPSMVGVPRAIHSHADHTSVAKAVASRVFANTIPAKPVASRFDPTLKPNQPTHRSVRADQVMSGRLCGGMDVCP